MEFRYKAKKSLDEVAEGKVLAESLEQALGQLEKQGLIPFVLEPAENQAALKKEGLKLSSGRWSGKKLTLFTQKLYNLTKSNVELLSALRLLQQGSGERSEKLLLEDIIKKIKDGLTLSQCLGHYPQFFPFLYVNIIRSGEATGQLKDSFSQLLSYLKRLEDLKSKIKQALAYPIFMVLVGAASIFVMLTFILPRLVGMFEDFEAALPLPTRVLLSVSFFFRKYWIVLLFSGFFLYFILIRSPKGRASLISNLKYHLPWIKDLVYKQALVNFSNSLSLLLKSGVSLLSGLNISASLLGNPKYIIQLEEVRKDIKEGLSFSQSLSKFRIFPELFTQMIRVGEEGGRLESVLSDIAESYEQEIDASLKIISSLLEPLIILALGLVIGGMVIAVLLPIFNLNTLVGT
ncbi:MAG: Type II secretion system F domain protein [Parcubacteria group bacterium GW2011_GWA2_43_17]|nr:MAG: Type II secretion system F domain protein [Parcubacteria group bacterium GW2011_GWA2_43_17]KKT91598.1 MAG: Type II secretion system F domain protein [Parcubacteria group bacterium GW2011_GWF2_45_11]